MEAINQVRNCWSLFNNVRIYIYIPLFFGDYFGLGGFVVGRDKHGCGM